MKRKEEIDWEQVKASCPEGYMVNGGETIDMLGKTEMWRIHEHNSEPHLTRIPQDLIDTPFGPCVARIPKEWGRCLYYKIV